jgi:hypothetical protein
MIEHSLNSQNNLGAFEPSELYSPREVSEVLKTRRDLLTSQNGHVVFEIEAYSSILIENGIVDPVTRRDLVAQYYGVIFPTKLV